MALTTSAWDRPIQGVSQQPPKVRLGGQCSVQENAVSSVVNGLIKRPGTSLQAYLQDTKVSEKTKWHYYNRGTGEKYFIAIEPNTQTPKVWDEEGNALVVENFLNGEPYLESADPSADLNLTTISDFTFIANNKVVPKEGSDKTGSLQDQAIINVQFADYGRHYRVYLDGDLAIDYLTPDGGQANHINYVDTSLVAKILFSGDTSLAPSAISGPGISNMAGFSADLIGNTIVVYKTDGSDFEIRTEDGADGRDVFVIKNSVKSVSDLPLYAPTNYPVKVVGEGNNDDDDYWLRAEAVNGDVITWKESTGPDQSFGFDVFTMPVTLIRDRFENGLAVFKLTPGDWQGRDVGDDETNPFPSFVRDGVPIESIGTLQNRLFVTAGESIIYTRSNEFFNFFRSTVRTALDDDPIDVYADTDQINVLKSSATLDGDAVFFSRNGQFVQSGTEPITKSNATLRYASTFESVPEVSPVAGGDVIFFAFEYGRYTGIREFFTDSFTDTKRARPITDHVDQYIESRVRLLATSTNRYQLLVLAQPMNVVYVYNYLWQGQDRVQSSWSKWIFDGDVLHIVYDDEIIYLMIQRDDGITLEYIETGDPNDPGLTFPVRLDRRKVGTAVRAGLSWEIRVDLEVTDDLVIVRGDKCLDAGVTIDYTDQGVGVLLTEENLAEEGINEVDVVYGYRYNMVYEPTMPFIRDRNGRVIDTDRLMINDVNINYDKTGLSHVYVENDWGSVREYSFNGRILGDSSNQVGFAPLEPGKFSFPVRQESDKVIFRIETDSHLPFQLRDMEWRGRFNQRGRRV